MSVNARQLINWQTTMSNTAHQREIADLQAAGLNPVLSAKFGGASTPSGAMDAGSGGSGGGSGPRSGTETPGNGFISDLINGLPQNGSIRFGKVSIPNSVIKTIYQYVGANLDEISRSLGQTFGINIGASDIESALTNNKDDDITSAPSGVKLLKNDFKFKYGTYEDRKSDPYVDKLFGTHNYDSSNVAYGNRYEKKLISDAKSQGFIKFYANTTADFDNAKEAYLFWKEHHKR